jgi:hypothetical protein
MLYLKTKKPNKIKLVSVQDWLSMRGMMTIDRDQWLNVTSESRDRI